MLQNDDELEKDDDIDDNIEEDDEEIHIVPVIPEEPVVFFGKEINAVLFEMMAGIILFGLICQVTVTWFIGDKLGFSLGLWVGILVAIGYSIHLWWSSGQYLYMGIYAARVAIRHMLFRYMVVALVLSGAAKIGKIPFLAVALGVVSIKAGAFAQPLLRKIIKRGNVDG